MSPGLLDSCDWGEAHPDNVPLVAVEWDDAKELPAGPDNPRASLKRGLVIGGMLKNLEGEQVIEMGGWKAQGREVLRADAQFVPFSRGRRIDQEFAPNETRAPDLEDVVERSDLLGNGGLVAGPGPDPFLEQVERRPDPGDLMASRSG